MSFIVLGKVSVYWLTCKRSQNFQTNFFLKHSKIDLKYEKKAHLFDGLKCADLGSNNVFQSENIDDLEK